MKMSEYQGTLDEIYNAEWVKGDFADLQPEFDVVADAVYRQFRRKRVIDIGCGPGNIILRLATHGCQVVGLEGSRHCIEFAHDDVRSSIVHSDIVKMPPELGWRAYDLVICTEVAEHLDEKDAPGLVALLCSAMCPIVFTAADEGQDGHHHVNCQPKDYWIEMFSRHGVVLDDKATHEMRRRWGSLKRLSHMRSNVMVFT